MSLCLSFYVHSRYPLSGFTYHSSNLLISPSTIQYFSIFFLHNDLLTFHVLHILSFFHLCPTLLLFLYSTSLSMYGEPANSQAYNLCDTNLLESSFRLNGQFSSHLVLSIMLILKDPILKIFYLFFEKLSVYSVALGELGPREFC